jgi:hypothetical protein
MYRVYILPVALIFLSSEEILYPVAGEEHIH